MKKIIIVMFMIFAGGLLAYKSNENQYYYDKYATLTGILKEVTVEDDMGYESGKSTQIYVLKLDSPITIMEETPVFGDGTPDIIEEVHVVESFEEKGTKPLKTSVGKRVKIKGELVKAHTGHHKRDAVLFDAVIE